MPKNEESRPSRTLKSVCEEGKTEERHLAELALSGIVNNACTVTAFSQGTIGEVDLTECVGVLKEKASAARKGDLGDAETLLISQAMALDSVFTEMLRRSKANMTEYLDASDRFMRLALKAQSQCRTTIETLAAMKNPPVVWAKQANIAHGPQQVNNTVNKTEGSFQSSTHAHAGAGNSKSVQNELLEDKSHEVERVDFGATQTTSRGDPAMATVGAINRPAHGARERKGEP